MALPRAWGPTHVPGKPPKPTPPKPPVIKKRPQAPHVYRPKPLDPNAQASANAMSAFRTALAQLQSSTPAVDSAAIYAPYRASQQVTGQLGQGFQTAVQGAGQAAQDQAAAAHAAAQQNAAQFGISAGAGANPTALPGGGPDQLAQQTAAYAAAAPAATAQWQALLERSAAAKVSDAQLQRQQGLTAAEQSLSGTIPTAIQNEKELGFRKDVQRQNMALAGSQLTAKQIADMRRYGIDLATLQQRGAQFKTTTAIKNRGIDEKTWADREKIKISKDTLALRKRAASVSSTGLKGVPAAVKAITGTAKSSKGAYRGWTVQVQPHDADGNPLGPVVEKHGPRKDWAPKGYKNVGGAKPYYDTNAAGKTGALGVTRATWDAQMRSLLAQNKDVPGAAAQIKRLLGPRPKS